MSTDEEASDYDGYLHRESLRLKHLINIACGTPVHEWPPENQDWDWEGCLDDLHFAIQRGDLEGIIHPRGKRHDLPITGVGYYKRAEQIGESLATANLANNLLRPGFINEARQRLFEARQKYGEDVHRNVSEHTGTAATAEAREEESLEEIRKRVPRVAKWKARLAEAIIQEPTTVSGEFTQGGLTLEVRSDGSVSGKLGVDSKDALVTGQVIGCMVEFSWKTTKPTEAPGSIASFLGSYYRERSGYGRGVIVSPSRIDGYHGEGDHPVDSTGSEKWTEFSLAAKEA